MPVERQPVYWPERQPVDPDKKGTADVEEKVANGAADSRATNEIASNDSLVL